MMLTRFVNHICGEISIQTHFLISMCANISETGFSCIQTVSSTGDLENLLAGTWIALPVVWDAGTLGRVTVSRRTWGSSDT